MRCSMGIGIFLAGAGVCFGQAGPRNEPTGTVTGHVICADTQRPARMASVMLLKVPTKSAATDREKKTMDAGDQNTVETGLDGGYTIRHVKPGEYYVVVDKEGYLLPLSQFSKDELSATDESTRTRLAAAARTISVGADQTVNEDVRLERGASVSGTATYDDGTPAGGLDVRILAKDKSGKLAEVPLGRYRVDFGFHRTDDKGQFRVTGLPAGEYVAEVDLTVSEHEVAYMPMPSNPLGVVEMHTNKTRFSLPLYSGDKLRRTTAEPFTLGAGQERTGMDVVFPLNKLHRVRGQVLASDGHAVNDGKVELLWADDRSPMTDAPVQFADQLFSLEFVPEGEFTLKTAGVKDVTHVQVENGTGVSPRFHEETRTVRSYGDTEQPLIVKGETSDVLVTVPDAKRTK